MTAAGDVELVNGIEVGYATTAPNLSTGGRTLVAAIGYSTGLVERLRGRHFTDEAEAIAWAELGVERRRRRLAEGPR